MGEFGKYLQTLLKVEPGEQFPTGKVEVRLYYGYVVELYFPDGHCFQVIGDTVTPIEEPKD